MLTDKKNNLITYFDVCIDFECRCLQTQLGIEILIENEHAAKWIKTKDAIKSYTMTCKCMNFKLIKGFKKKKD